MENNIIEIKNLKKIFFAAENQIVALDDINLQIEKGSIFGIIGLSGAGKSTLVRMMNYLEKPTCGEVLFKGIDLSKLTEKSLRELRKQIGMIFQNFNLLEQVNVIKNVMFPLEISHMKKEDRIERAKYLLKLVGLSDKEKAYPSQLSGGQKQRVAIARALATNPKVILCDEATSALDPKTTSQILELLKKINREMNVTIVIITHQMSVIESICDRVAIIDNSKIAEIGDVKDIFKNPKTEIGKKLIFGNYIENINELNLSSNGKKIRLAFDGTNSNEPIISNMVLSANSNCNILYANAKEIDGNVFGEMIIELPKDEKRAEKMKEYLKKSNVTFWDV